MVMIYIATFSWLQEPGFIVYTDKDWSCWGFGARGATDRYLNKDDLSIDIGNHETVMFDILDTLLLTLENLVLVAGLQFK